MLFFVATISSACSPEQMLSGQEPKAVNALEAARTADELGLSVGQKPIRAKEANRIFKASCVQHQSPGLEGMKQNPRSRTWYHQDYNLSINASKGDMCSIIFGSQDRPGAVADEFYVPKHPKFIGVRPTGDELYGQDIYLAAQAH